MNITLGEKNKKGLAYFIAVLGALGGALQNYIAVNLFLKGIVGGALSLSHIFAGFRQVMALGFGGVCSGMVNFFINVDLLEGFLERLTRNKPGTPLQGWVKFSYYAGIFVFVVTGLLFGMTAFTLGMATPMAAFAVVSGVFVAIIMTIQEVETWLQGFDDPKTPAKRNLRDMFLEWKSSLTPGTMLGHVIAAGNVVALSLLFTLGLAEVLIALQVAALPALIIGISISFTFGAFTEFYFYNFFLAKFCDQLIKNWHAMKATVYAPFGLFFIASNAVVNAALTYSGVGLLTGLLVATGIGLPPVGIIIVLGAVSAFFSGSASLLLGMDFWIRKMTPTQNNAAPTLAVIEALKAKSSYEEEPYVSSGISFFRSSKKEHGIDLAKKTSDAAEKDLDGAVTLYPVF
jgi:hypothetical protein